MHPRLSLIPRSRRLAATFFFAAALAPLRLGFAAQPVADDTDDVPCAIVSDLSGGVQVLDASRTVIREGAKKAAVACGSWVSVAPKGWIRLELRDGFGLNLAGDTFVELPEDNPDGRNQGEQVVLYRGEAYAKADAGLGELRILTANARARLARGAMAVVYSREGQETQLIALENQASLENRFQAKARVEVRAGEASSLSLDLQRVMPASPRAVAVASLREKLARLHVPERERGQAVRLTQRRHDRKIASALEEFDAKPAASAPTRKTASVRSPASAEGGAYVRNVAHPEDGALRSHMVERITGGTDPAELRAKKAEEKEKRRLIEELSKVKED